MSAFRRPRLAHSRRVEARRPRARSRHSCARHLRRARNATQRAMEHGVTDLRAQLEQGIATRATLARSRPSCACASVCAIATRIRTRPRVTWNMKSPTRAHLERERRRFARAIGGARAIGATRRSQRDIRNATIATPAQLAQRKVLHDMAVRDDAHSRHVEARRLHAQPQRAYGRVLACRGTWSHRLARASRARHRREATIATLAATAMRRARHSRRIKARRSARMIVTLATRHSRNATPPRAIATRIRTRPRVPWNMESQTCARDIGAKRRSHRDSKHATRNAGTAYP